MTNPQRQLQRQQRTALSLLALVCLSAGVQVATAAAAVAPAAANAGADAAKASAASLLPNLAQMQQAAEAANNFIATVKNLKQTVDKVPALGNYLNRTLEQIPGIDKLSVLSDGVQLSDLSAVRLPTNLDELKNLKLPNFDFKAVEGGKVALNLTGIADKFGVDLGALAAQFKESKLGEIVSVPAEKFNKLPKGVRQALVWVTVANVVGAAGIKSAGAAKAAAAKMGLSGGAILSLMAGKGLGGGHGGAAGGDASAAAAAEPAAAAATGLPKLSAPKFDLKAIASKFGVKIDDNAAPTDTTTTTTTTTTVDTMMVDTAALQETVTLVKESGSVGGRPLLSAEQVHADPSLCGCPRTLAPVCTGRNIDFDNECLARCTGALVIRAGTCADLSAVSVSDGGGASSAGGVGGGGGAAARRRRLLQMAAAAEQQQGSGASGRTLQGLLPLVRSQQQQDQQQAEAAAKAGGDGSSARLTALRLAATAARAVGGQYTTPEDAAAAEAPRRSTRRVTLRVTAEEAEALGATLVAPPPQHARVQASLLEDGRETMPQGKRAYLADAPGAASGTGGAIDVKVVPPPPSVVDALKAQIKARTG
jgi:hypothetical protein